MCQLEASILALHLWDQLMREVHRIWLDRSFHPGTRDLRAVRRDIV